MIDRLVTCSWSCASRQSVKRFPLLIQRKSVSLAMVGAIFTSLMAAGFAAAEEPFVPFLQGLRERQYYDFAIVYLDGLATRPDVPEEMRQLIPYEKAVTLIESSRQLRNPARQLELLDQGEAFLAQFVKESPNHPKAGDANYERASIILNKARVEIIQSRSPNNQAAKGEYQARARALIQQAREIFQTAYNQYEAHWKTFPAFIDESQDAQKKRDREQAEIQLIKAALDLSLCTYEQAQTYSPDQPDFRKLLSEAAVQFEQLHQRYRSQGVGLYARLWQGKCFEEQGDLQKAMGIYNELLSHPGDSSALRQLKDKTLQFKLIVLNNEARKDHQLVVNMAQEWLKQNTTAARTSVGLAIRWQLALALEALGDDRTLAKTDAERNWRSARGEALNIIRFPSEYRDVSQALIQRVDGKLGGRDRKPETFDQAFGLARQLVNEAKPLREALSAAKAAKKSPEEIQKAETDVKNKLADAAEMFQDALRLAGPKDDTKSISNARYLYSYVLYLQRRNYESAILGEYVAKTTDSEDGSLALDAAYLAMGAYVQAFNDMQDLKKSDDADLAFIVKACNLITMRWPDSDRANDARMQLGRIYTTRKRPADAAIWFGQVPDADGRFAEAQLASGQAYWSAYLTEASKPAEERPAADQLLEWRVAADQHLRTGMAKLIATMPKEGAAPEQLIAAKVSLAQILISLGKEADAIQILTADPHSVVKAVAFADESKRPAKGVQSRVFATEAYKILLRAYVGAGKLDEARATMKTLETIAGGAGGGDVTQLYVQLGQLLKSELDRFRESGETAQFNRLMTSFETFLGDLAKRKEGQTFGSLSWIGETYFALGEASTDNVEKATASFTKAGDAFAEILKNATAQLGYAPPQQILVVKLRLVTCKRMQKDFPEAERLITEVLQERPDDLQAQTEAARVYESWGSSDQTDGVKYLQMAISGNRTNGTWGWGSLASRLQNTLSRGLRPELQANFLEAHYHSALCQKRIAEAQTKAEDRINHFERAEMELVATNSITKDMPEEWHDKYNDLYREILQAAGKIPEDLPVAENFDSVAASTPVNTAPVETAVKAAAGPTATGKVPPPTGSTTTYVAFALLVILGLAGVAFAVLKSGKRPGKKSPYQRKPLPAEIQLGGFSAPPTPSAATPPERPKTRTRPSAAAPQDAPKPRRPATAPPTAKPAPPKKPE